MIIGIDGLGGHEPFRLVRRSIHLFNIQRAVKFSGFELHFQEGVALFDFHWRIVNPLVWVSDLDTKPVHLFQSLFSRRVRLDPVDFLKSILQCLSHLFNDLKGPLFAGLVKVLGAVQLPQSFAQGTFGKGHRPLPSRLDFLRPAQGLFVKVKMRLDKGFGQVRSTRFDRTPTKVRRQGVRIVGSISSSSIRYDLCRSFQRLDVANVNVAHSFYGLSGRGLKIGGKIKAGTLLHEFGHCHFVVRFVRISILGSCHVSFG
mmetsp:Transcript_24893/g.37998  ORF Transcript_24893/g.37998 Transcript_24893/m.37998 type:complete len:258 (-) Transcript_24893:903-1676(-)